MTYMPYMRAASYGSESDFRDSLRADHADRCAVLSEVGIKPIKHITVVGANKPARLSFQGSDEDSKRIAALLRYMKNAAMLIDPDFELDGVDFIAGRDFLKEDHQTDMVLVSCILKEPVKNRPDISGQELAYYKEKNTAQYDPIHAFALATCLSEDHTPAHWKKRIEGSGAQIVWTFGGVDEVSSEYVLGPSYTPVIQTPNRRIMDWKDCHETCESFYGDPYRDLPMLWLGCNMDSTVLSKYKDVPGDEKNAFFRRVKTSDISQVSKAKKKKRGIGRAHS